LSGPTASLALVAKAGTRYEWVPGLAEALEKFAFRVRLADPLAVSLTE
jgi:ubiquinol-cytochrome c reductase core subunit 2